MGKNKNSGGKSSTAKTKKPGAGAFIVAVALLLGVVYVITSLALGIRAGAPVWNPVDWVPHNTAQSEPEPDDKTEVIAVTSDGQKLMTANSYAMPRAMSFVQKQSTYSKSKEFTVTATLSNQYINGVFDWAVSFVNSDSEWATGKVTEYYVQAIPTTDGSATAKIKYISSFKEPINVTATLRGTDKSDSCQIDCLKDFEIVSLWTDACDFDDNLDGGCELTSTTGTACAEYRVKSVYLNVDFSDDIQKYLKFNLNFIYDYHFENELNNKTLYVDEQSDNRLQLSFGCSHLLSYADFIENFDAFDDEHKEAVYYAWYHGAAGKSCVIYIELSLYVNGVDTGLTVNYECSHSTITGQLYGQNVQPNVTLNQNIIF